MKVTEHFKNAQDTLFSFEILPPLKGQTLKGLFDHIEPLMEFKPPFIDVTYHREEYVYKKRENGLLEKRSIRKRPGTVGICAAIQNHFNVDTVPHLICGGFSKEETENALIDMNFLGIDNVLALRGDCVKSETRFVPEPDGHHYASELVAQIAGMNRGRYLDEEQADCCNTDFCIGVAGYPEKHFEAPNAKADLRWLKKKVDLGAEYIVTQMFFDNKKYFDFVASCREAGITVPIIPGLKPITTKTQLNLLPSLFHLEIPDDLASALENCKDNLEASQLGVEWAVQQSKELMQAGVPCLHFYSMGKSDAVRRIAEQLF
ncbi:methylenetetrahydrofolate reductase [NAD(P)H] [Adhaeribacter sp. BT258]|uniref:Methylenetetrahydrofolate reductase n=1 Tax=Adhaeribacter terrigena TaxID=2793070 RepID=A0ABS1BZP7_9BACT|nr:methylenetetrahydrofolate reductase [NAD(P)H] [Adhaeribacter terrigena]MBK0402626.1 methylenetetrahydrofolate reductase [NAD(P)H] [Adhaeribacter terrigena]